MLALAVVAPYVIYAFTAPDPLLRIAMRCLPILPVAVWTIWFDPSRPLQHGNPLVSTAGRVLFLVLVMAFAILLLGIGLNWLYDPSRVV